MPKHTNAPTPDTIVSITITVGELLAAHETLLAEPHLERGLCFSVALAPPDHRLRQV